MRRSMFAVPMMMVLLTSISVAQTTDEQDINRLFKDLEQALVKRSSPDALLAPSMTALQRHKEAEKTARPYLNIKFRYNVGDLKLTSSNEAELPLIVEWETVHESGSITDSADLIRVDGRWYFRDFDFMTFTWPVILFMVVMGACAVAFVVFVFYLYHRLRKAQPQQAAA